jgi:hypothetical protein
LKKSVVIDILYLDTYRPSLRDVLFVDCDEPLAGEHARVSIGPEDAQRGL